ncbi:MAG: hypothetical protein LBN29_01360 [Mediterranea sp.]|jgi:hypothetical protein|nr:hypothetical protein [Mediterranea sp.]
MEPSHSPFGTLGQIARDTGWSVNYIRRRVNYPMLMLMMSDAPRYVDAKQSMLDYYKNHAAGKQQPQKKQPGLHPLEAFKLLEEQEE